MHRRACGLAVYVGLVGWLILQPVYAVGQPVQSVTAPAEKQTAAVSASHVFAKTVTQVAANSLVAMTIFTIGTGSVVTGGVLTGAIAATSAVLYPANEYLWDYYAPNTNLRVNNETFDAGASAWRNTGKYVTFKAAAMFTKFGWLFAYTQSVASTAVMGVATSLALPAVFFANNMAWDWYDWYSSAPTASGRSQ